MEKTIVVGDIHGHIPTVEAALASPCNVVFVGDYLDSFSQGPENQVACLRMVLDAAEAEPDRVVALRGNHEMSYMVLEMRCSGYNQHTATLVTHLQQRMWDTLKAFHWVGEYLITHAGVDQELLDSEQITVEEYLEGGNFLQIGTSRGGYAYAGGLYWNDFTAEMIPVPGLKQVVGHSNSNRNERDVEGVRVKRMNGGETWCVDNLNRTWEVLMIDVDGVAKPVPLLDKCRNCREAGNYIDLLSREGRCETCYIQREM